MEVTKMSLFEDLVLAHIILFKILKFIVKGVYSIVKFLFSGLEKMTEARKGR